MISPILYKDYYKTDHRRQYPEGTQYVYSNLTPRESRVGGVDEVVVFGIQYFCKEYLIRQFNEGFFNKPVEEVVKKYKRRMDTSLGLNAIGTDHIRALHALGYLPIEIKALPEGTKCKLRVPVLTIQNTNPEFFWLTNFLETLLCCSVWQPMTSATIAHQYRKMLDKFAAETSDMPDFVQWQGHDFSMRGHTNVEASMTSGAGHLLSFTGTDTIPAIDFLEDFYYADAEKELIGGSVPATEHSVVSMGSNIGLDGLSLEEQEEKIAENEFNNYYKRLITEVYPSGIVSMVSDTYDYWRVLTQYLPELKNIIMARDGKLVIRPDSGDPVKIVCGDPAAPEGSPANKGSIQLLWETFGGRTNSNGYKQLDPHIGLIYGDSITIERCKGICQGLKDKGFTSTNMVFGIGSFTYQYVTRDTFGFAMKATYGVINDKSFEIFKKPKTDSGMKNSARGLLHVTEDGKLIEQVTPEMEATGLLKTIFKDGKMIKEYTLSEIRARLKGG